MNPERTRRQGTGRARAARVVVSLLALLLAPATVRSQDAKPVDPSDVGSGELLWKSARGFVPLPVLDMKVELAVTGIMVRGIVTQTFDNPTAEVIEAVYVFPLPERAAVDAMEMRIGERRIRAVVREREEAKATYEQAKREGRKAGLVEQERPNLFTTSVAGINPGESVVVRLEYLEEVAYGDGGFGLVFPLTFTPRYTSFGRDDPGIEGRFVKTAGPLAPRATLEVRLDAGLLVEGVRSTSHAIHLEPDGAAWRVELDGGSVVADRDFVLRWMVRRDARPEGAAFVEDREDGRYGLVMILPPVPESAAGGGLPTETLFVVDVSGSMDGPSIEQARKALLKALDRLRPGDTFNILKFNDLNEPFRERFLSTSGTALDEARAWVRSLVASGGTEILPALLRGINMMEEADPWPARRIVLITDGAVADEEGLFAEVTRRLGAARLHIIGIGWAPNRCLVRRLAEFGRGSCEFIGGAAEIEARMDSFLTRIDRPVMTDLALDWQGAPPLEVYPERIPDLYAGKPLFVSVRLGPSGDGARAVLTGRVAGGPVRIDVGVAPDAPPGSGVATRWARAKVEGLLDGLRDGADAETVRRAVIGVALTFGLVTRYTSLVAVEEFPSADGSSTTHKVAAALPQGSTLLDGTLPQGGTSGPLLTLIGLFLVLVGALAGLLDRLARRAR
jgi:Ca-activated chloride channel family protein